MHSVLKSTEINNKLLKSLPDATFERLAPALEIADLRSGETIDHVDGPIEHLYFVNRGLVSLVIVMRDGRVAEVSAVGIEGVTDSNALFGVNPAVVESIVQISGSAFKVSREYLQEEMSRDSALQTTMQRYARYAFGQLARTAACNRLHKLEERCCRWILTGHDSAFADTFLLTHEFLGMMLGAPRSSVSLAAKILQKSGCIDYSRGTLTIIDRNALKDAACECYFHDKAEWKRIMGSVPPAPQRRLPFEA